MKKIFAISILSSLMLSLSSCSDSINKKVILPPPDNPPVVQEKQNTSDPKTVEKTTQSNKEDIENKETLTDKSHNQVNDDTSAIKNENNPDNDLKIIPENLSNEKIGNWMPARNKEHKVPVLSPKYKNPLDKYGGYFVGDTSSKVIYLTFDEGYENGYTSRILDTMKENDVKATFFVVKSYIKVNPGLVKRMVEEGHIVGNHSDRHPSMPDVSNERVMKEITDTADYFKEVTGHDMPKFFRPPQGEWSERTLYITHSLGYKTILWSVAHADWDVKNQPPLGAAAKYVDTYYHNGAILLLHPQSKTNTEDMESIIKNLKDKGYRFGLLSELR